jgi:hypothetical protein
VRHLEKRHCATVMVLAIGLATTTFVEHTHRMTFVVCGGGLHSILASRERVG